MAEEKIASNKIIFSLDKQKELYDVISVVFSEDLKTSNCFILPAVGQRAGLAMREKGFDKANKATFLAAPEYFVLGYNKKNVDAISLVGYPKDPNFSTSLNEDFVPASKQNSVQLTHEQQRTLAEIFVEVFKDHNKKGKVFLATVGIKASKQISEAGLGRVSIELFKGASDYFLYDQDSRGAYIVFLKDDCDISMPKTISKQEKKKTSPPKTSPAEKMQFEDLLFARLKKTYRTNDVSVSNILIFLRNNKMVPPYSFEELIELLAKKYGSVFRDNGEGTVQEQYIILRKPLPVPQDVCNRVELIVAEFFLNRDLISNTDIGNALKNNGIDYEKYNFADLTAFLRSFSNIFTIVPQPAANNKVHIFVRILPSFKKRYANVEFNYENQDQILQSQFEKVIIEMFDKGKYGSIIEQSVLREAIKHFDGEMWNCIIKAYLIINGTALEKVHDLTEWEKAVFNFEYLSENVSDEFLSSFSFKQDEITRIKQYILDYSHKSVNYSTLAQRIQSLCGNDSYLIDVILNIGLLARLQGDKTFCFRLLMLYYARNDESKARILWADYAKSCINPSSMIMIVGSLFSERNLNCIVEFTRLYNAINVPSEVVQLYYTYACLILDQSDMKMPSLSILENRRSIELVIAFLESAKEYNRSSLYIEMVYNCLNDANEFVSISSIVATLQSHSDFLNDLYDTLIQGAKNRERVSWVVLRQLISLGILKPDKTWNTIYNTMLVEYKKKIAECTAEEKEPILYEAIDYFPTESSFVDELVSVIKKTGSSDGENLEGFINNIIDSGNYDQVIMLYEHDSSLELRDKVWFLRKLSYCNQKKLDLKKSLDVEMAIISTMLNNGEEINNCLTQVISILYDGFISRSLISLDEGAASKLFLLFNHYKCESIDAHKYWIAMMGLALCAKNMPLLSLFYCLSSGISEEIDFLAICEDEIRESPLGYSYRVGELQRTFEYVLTQESPEVFFAILGRASNVIRLSQDEKNYSKYKDSIETVEPEKIITLIISDYDKERAWRLLSEYAYKSKKVTLNFVANSVLFFKFKDTVHALTNCTNSLDYHVDNSLPRNFRWCCLSIWNTDLGRPVEGFKRSFINHIRRCNSFQDVNQDIVAQWYDMLCNQKKPGENEFLVATEIAKQTDSFGEFYRTFFKADTAYKALINSDVASFVRFCSAFVYCADDASFYDALNEIRELRNQIGSFSISKNDRSALMWLDDLMANRGSYASDGYFLEASMAVLSSYPEVPSNDIVSKWITPDSSHRLPNYDLLRNWINTFGNMRIVNTADYAIRNYISKNSLSDDPEERENFFKIRFFLAEQYIVFFNRLHSNTNDDFLRRCKTYYGLRKLAKIATPIPADFKDKMHKDLEYFDKLEAYLNYEAGIEAFVSTVDDDYIKERFIYCGITNYWDKVLEECLKYCEELVPYIDAIEEYYKVIDYRPIRRRLLQMYVFSYAGQLMIDGEVDTTSIANHKDVRYYYNRISKGDIVLSEYLPSVTKLIEILQPSLLGVIKLLEEANSSSERLQVIQGIIFVLSNKNLKQFREKVELVEEKTLNNIVLPAMVVIQHGSDISKMLLQMSLNSEKYAAVMLDNELLSSVIGKYETNLFKSILCINNEDYDGASTYLSLAGSRSDIHGLLYDRLREAITNKAKLNIEEDFGGAIPHEDTLPRFSFMKTSDPSGMGLHQLVSDFYSENLYDAKGKCLLASKILFLIEDGAPYNDAINLLFDWGFVEIEATFDIEKKANILFEMLDKIDKLKDVKAFKERFVRNFLYLLQEFDFSILLKNFKRIFDCHMILYTRFKPYDNCDCYAQAVVMLRDLYKLGKENVDPNTAMTQINDIKSKILALHMKFPQNRFATKCIDYVERFVQQIFERGVFEVNILNESRLFDGVIYYQVRNKGYELISNISLTFAIEGVPNTIEQVRINSIIPEGLRPNQVYAGEYAPGVDFDDETEIGCSITVEYSVSDEDGQEEYKNYVAVDPNIGGKLTVRTIDTDTYQKDDSAGYSEEPIKQESDFIGRKKELNLIMGKILKGQNVLLFGTNGTGKSSILYNIRKVCLPAAYSDEEQHLGKHYAAELKFDTDCTEKNVLESIVKAVSGATLFKVFVKRNGNEETQDILNMAFEEWKANVDKMFDENGSCINSDAVRQYFVTLDEALSLSNLDLYILIDQFERVISSENIKSKHMLFLRDLTCQNIRFILAGSNYLLEEVSVDKINNQQENSWSDIFSRGFEKIKIGNMDQEDFELLITQKNALNNGSVHYTAEALSYLWQFTKGHAFYSCLLGNRTLDIMSNRKVRRDVIYPSDIFIAIYQPGKYLPNEKSNKAKETAIKNQIFQDIIDNTPIKFVGKTLARMQSSGERKVSYQKLRDYIEEHRPDIIDNFADALSILVARDFITYDEIDIQRQTRQTKPEDLRTAREYYFTSDLYLEHFATVYVPELSTQEKEELESKKHSLEALEAELRTRTFEEIEELRRRLPSMFKGAETRVIHTDKYVEGDDKSSLVQVNIQNMTNAFNQILSGATGEQLLASIADLPRLERYYDEKALPELIGRIESGDVEAEAELARGSDQMISDYQSALIKQEDDDEFCVWKVLGIQKDEYDYLSEKMSPNFMMDLFFAAKLESIFAIIDDDDSIQDDKKDFSPVSIMYCKIVEKMLKRYHTDVYQKRLPDASTEQKYQKELVRFGDLSNPKIKKKIKNKITLGAFLFPINPAFPHEDSYNALAKTDSKKEKWEKHGAMLSDVTDIRNKSAHGVAGSIVDSSLLYKLKTALFEDEGLLNIILLSE